MISDACKPDHTVGCSSHGSMPGKGPAIARASQVRIELTNTQLFYHASDMQPNTGTRFGSG
jgi:hypothetical protein